MSNTVRHWKRGYQCDHTARSAPSALGEALRCAGKHVDDQSLWVLSISLTEYGEIKDENLMYRLVGK